MRLRRYCWAACLALLVLVRGEAFAAAVPAYSGKMNNAVGGLISQKVGKWGFAANDPRFGATMTGVSTAATTVAVGIATGAVATVGWPALLIGAGVSALAAGAVSLGQDALINWLWPDSGNPGKVQLGGSGMSSLPVYSNGVTAGQYAWQVQGGYWGSPQEALSYVFATSIAQYSQATFYNVTWVQNSPLMWTASYKWKNPQLGFNTEQSGTKTANRISYSGITCPGGTGFVSGSTCTDAGLALPGNGLGGSVYTSAWKLPADAVADLPQSYTTQPVSDAMLAQAANAAWKQMGSTTPNALPWSATDPITPADVASWKAANPNSVPTVNDFIGPVAPTSSTTVPISDPATTTNTSTAPSTSGTGTTVDLGPNPNTPAPTLETTPTASAIMSPILNLMPDLKSFVVPGHTSTCATGGFDWNGHHYSIDAQCTLIEQNRSLIEGAMLLVWAIAAIFIVLRA